MKNILTIVLLCCAILAGAYDYKVNRDIKIKTYDVKIEKIEVKNGETVVYGKVKQKRNFSYNISFEDCYLTLDNYDYKTAGTLRSWNDEKKGLKNPKPVSDQRFEKFTLSFPGTACADARTITIKVGNIQDRQKTEIIFRDVILRKE